MQLLQWYFIFTASSAINVIDIGKTLSANHSLQTMVLPYYRSNSSISKIIPTYCCIILLLSVAQNISAEAKKFYFKQDTFIDSQALPIEFVYKKWDAPYQAGTLTQGFVRAESGYIDGNQSIGIIYRFDIQAKYTAETITWLHQLKNKTPLSENKEYDIFLDIKHFRAWGIIFDYVFKPTPTLTVTPSLSILRAHYLTDGILQGNAVAINKKDYDFDLNVDYYYSKDELFDRRVTPPTGWGFSFDLDLQAKPIDNLAIKLKVYDLFGYLFWNSTPRTVAQADSSIKNYDLNGYLNFEPVLTGKESNEGFAQKLTPRVILQSEYIINRLMLNQQIMFTALKNYYFFDTGFLVTKSQWLIIGTETTTNTLKLAYKTNTFKIEVLTDSLNTQKIHTLAVNLSLSYAL